MNYSFSAKEVREELSEQLKEARGQDNVSDIEMIFHVACSFNLLARSDERSLFAALQAVGWFTHWLTKDDARRACNLARVFLVLVLVLFMNVITLKEPLSTGSYSGCHSTEVTLYSIFGFSGFT